MGGFHHGRNKRKEKGFERRNLGIDTTTLTVSGSIVGIIFSIGCQNTVADILSGILMAFEGIVQVGDFLNYDGKLGFVQTVGVRAVTFKWRGEITIVRNNDLKNFVNRPHTKLITIALSLHIALTESLERVEAVMRSEMPAINAKLRAKTGRDVVGPEYVGVEAITPNSFVLFFQTNCLGSDYWDCWLLMNHELKLICERNDIAMAMPQIVINRQKNERIGAGKE